MREGAHADDVAVVLARHRRDLDHAARDLVLGDRVEAVALLRHLAGVAEGHAVRERGAHHGIFVEPDRRLQRAADEGDGKEPGQHRAGEPAQADAPAIRRPIGEIARIKRVLVSEVDNLPGQALSLERCQYPRPRSLRAASREGRRNLAAS